MAEPEPGSDSDDELEQLRAEVRAVRAELVDVQTSEAAAQQELEQSLQHGEHLAVQIRILRGELQFQTSFCHTLKESVARVKDLSARWRPRPGGVALHYADELDAALRGAP